MTRRNLLINLLENEKDLLIFWYPEDKQKFEDKQSKVKVFIKWQGDNEY